jgi:hypothetical protein
LCHENSFFDSHQDFYESKSQKYKLLLCRFISRVMRGDRSEELDVVKEKHENIILITRDIKTRVLLEATVEAAEKRK